jgi:large subunit ribosomal protein L31e
MAEKTPATEEKIFTIPLRAGWVNEPKNKRAKRAVNDIKLFLRKNLKVDDVFISEKLNDEIWKSGAQMPPPRIKVKVKAEDGTAKARLPDEVEVKDTKEKKETRAKKAEEKKEAKEKATEQEKPKQEAPKEKTELDKKLEN